MQRVIITVPHVLTPSQTKYLRAEVGRWLRGETAFLLLDGGCTAHVVDIPEGQPQPEVSVEERLAKFKELFGKDEEGRPITVRVEG